MPVTTRCPNCRLKYQVREESLGARATCKKCGQSFTVEITADATLAPQPGSAASAPPERLDLTGSRPEQQNELSQPVQPAADARAVPDRIGP